jgi:hypothetical protein
MRAWVDVSFEPARGGGSEVVAFVVFRIRCGEPGEANGVLDGLELELHGTRICRASGGELFLTWPARFSKREGRQGYWDFVRGPGAAEARKRLIRAFESQARKPG